jgi:hypothetical protein
VLALLWEKNRGQCFCFPLGALLFVPQKGCVGGFQTKIELAIKLLGRLKIQQRRLIVVVDNLYAEAQLIIEALHENDVLVSRLRSNSRLHLPPPPRIEGQRGRPRKRGEKKTARQLYRRRSQRRNIIVNIYGSKVRLDVFTGTVIPSPTLGEDPIGVVIFPQRSGKIMNIFFTTDLTMNPQRLLELYAARFIIEDAFDELKTHGGFGDCRQRLFTALKRLASLCMVAYSLLRLLSLTLKRAERLAAEPWWHPVGPPSVTRIRRTLARDFGISFSLCQPAKVIIIPTHKQSAQRKQHRRQVKAI